MQLKPEQVKKFRQLHKDTPGFEKYSEEEVIQIANGVANYYLTLFKIYQRVNKNKVITTEDIPDG